LSDARLVRPQLDHGVDRGTVPQLIGVKPTEPTKLDQPLCINGDTQNHNAHKRPLGRADSVLVRPYSGVVRTAILARKKRACFRRAIPQIGNRQLPAEDSVLGVATTSRVKSVAAF